PISEQDDNINMETESNGTVDGEPVMFVETKPSYSQIVTGKKSNNFGCKVDSTTNTHRQEKDKQ
ncbi:36267_t:CDS:1, partial [Gigaspora margarita]